MDSNGTRCMILVSERDYLEDDMRPTAHSLFCQADDLLRIGFARASCTIARQAIEAALVECCAAHGIWPENPQTHQKISTHHIRMVPIFSSFLEMTGVVRPELRPQIRKAAAYGNRASHRRAVGLEHAALLLDVCRELFRIVEHGLARGQYELEIESERECRPVLSDLAAA